MSRYRVIEYMSLVRDAVSKDYCRTECNMEMEYPKNRAMVEISVRPLHGKGIDGIFQRIRIYGDELMVNNIDCYVAWSDIVRKMMTTASVMDVVRRLNERTKIARVDLKKEGPIDEMNVPMEVYIHVWGFRDADES